MLQQILRDMWVAPEILAELDETQKQTLFCKMREEQIRRWRVWDQKLSKQEEQGIVLKPSIEKKNKQKKSVHFLQSDDGEPWVLVMGESDDDKTIEEILEEETLEKARTQALKETLELRKSVERELSLIEFNNEQMDSMEKDCILLKQLEKIEDIYCSVDELREKMKLSSDAKANETINEDFDIKIQMTDNYQNNKNNNMNYKNNITKFNLIEGKRDILQELSINKDQKVSVRVAQWEKKVTEQRTGEILQGLRNKQAQALKEAEELASVQQKLWEEQEKKAKEAETKMREIARKAREEYKRASILNEENKEIVNGDSPSLDSDICYMDPAVHLNDNMKPPNKDAVVHWFVNTEKSKGAGLDEEGNPAKWFHGLISRSEAESLLQDCPEGSYLVRVSERIWGYAISYKAAERCKHYLIDASQNSHYQFLGANQVTHKTLANLVSYYNKNIITEAGKERLLIPCESSKMPQIMEAVS